MDGLLSLKWNNHSSSFRRQFATVRSKSLYCDATVICEGVYFSVHKLILSTCSDYFSEIFENIQCKHPFIIIKDVGSTDMEILLNYMYEGEVKVLHERLPNLIKSAEALKVKGLSLSDDESFQSKKNITDKHSTSDCIDIHAKRKTEDFSDVTASNSAKKLNTNEDLESKVMEIELEQCNLTNESNDRSLLSNYSFIDHLLNNEQNVKKEPIETPIEVSANFLQQEIVELGPSSLNTVNSDQLSPSNVQNVKPLYKYLPENVSEFVAPLTNGKFSTLKVGKKMEKGLRHEITRFLDENQLIMNVSPQEAKKEYSKLRIELTKKWPKLITNRWEGEESRAKTTLEHARFVKTISTNRKTQRLNLQNKAKKAKESGDITSSEHLTSQQR